MGRALLVGLLLVAVPAAVFTWARSAPPVQRPVAARVALPGNAPLVLVSADDQGTTMEEARAMLRQWSTKLASKGYQDIRCSISADGTHLSCSGERNDRANMVSGEVFEARLILRRPAS